MVGVFMKSKIYAALTCLMFALVPLTAHADDNTAKAKAQAPIKMSITGVVVGKNIKNASIVSIDGIDYIWWEGQVKKIRVPKSDKWITLKLIKVESRKNVGGVLTFEIRGRKGRPARFEVKLKQSRDWGLSK